MANNLYPIQIKKRMSLNLVSGFIWIVAISLIVAIFSLTIAVYTAIIIGVFVVIGMLWDLLYLDSIEYALDRKNLTFKGGIISRFEKVLPYSKIQHVITYESFWQRVLGLSSVSIETARESELAQDTGPFIPDLNTEEAEKLKNYIISISNTKYRPVAGV